MDTLRRRRTRFLDAWRSRLWPVPALGVLTAIVAGIAIPEIDGVLDQQMPPVLSSYLFGGGADAAREVLGGRRDLAHHRDLADVLADRRHAAVGQ